MAGDTEAGKEIGDAYDQAVTSDLFDKALGLGANAGLAAIGMGGASIASSAATHALLGSDMASRRMNLSSQMQGSGNIARRLGKLDPRITEMHDQITRELAAAERKQMQVMDDPKYLRFAQDYSAIPQSWSDALNLELDNGGVGDPPGTVNGKTFQEWRHSILGLMEDARDRLNEARKKHGLETMGKLKSIHPSSYSSWGTDNFYKQFFGELMTGIKNTEGAITGRAKGFGNREKIASELHEGLFRHAQYSPEGFFIPLDDVKYLEHARSKTSTGADVQIKDGKAYLMEDGHPVKSSDELHRWLNTEANRFQEIISSLGNVDKEMGQIDPATFHQKLPFMPSAHQATFTDWMNHIMGMDMESAALEAHSPDLMQKIDRLHDLPTGLSQGDKKIANDINALRTYLGTSGAKDATTLAGRVAQQQGRLSSGDGNIFTRLASAWAPLTYKMQLSMNPTPAAAQQGQVASQMLAFMPGDKQWLYHGAKSYLKSLGTELKNQFTPGARSELNIRHAKWMDPFGLDPMKKGSGLIENAIGNDAERIVGNALENGNKDWLLSVYTPEELDRLKSLRRADGTVDLSNPDDKELGQSVVARYLEGHNGLDLPTSKPAFMYSKAAKALGMYVSTPMVVVKAVTDLYRPGGMFHGTTGHNAAGKAFTTAALAGQLLSSNAIRSSATAKAVALLSAGASFPALMSAYAAMKGYESGGEQSNAQQLEQLMGVSKKIATMDGNPAELGEEFGKLATTMFFGTVPLKVASASDLTSDFFAGSIDKRALNAGAPMALQGGAFRKLVDNLGMFSPAIAAPLGIAGALSDAYGEFSDEGRRSVYGPMSLLMRDLSPLRYIRSYSPLLPETGMEVGQKENPKYYGTKTRKRK